MSLISRRILLISMALIYLRIWTASSDYSDDLRIGKEIIGSAVDAYRKLRNTLALPSWAL